MQTFIFAVTWELRTIQIQEISVNLYMYSDLNTNNSKSLQIFQPIGLNIYKLAKKLYRIKFVKFADGKISLSYMWYMYMILALLGGFLIMLSFIHDSSTGGKYVVPKTDIHEHSPL